MHQACAGSSFFGLFFFFLYTDLAALLACQVLPTGKRGNKHDLSPAMQPQQTGQMLMQEQKGQSWTTVTSDLWPPRYCHEAQSHGQNRHSPHISSSTGQQGSPHIIYPSPYAQSTCQKSLICHHPVSHPNVNLGKSRSILRLSEKQLLF